MCLDTLCFGPTLLINLLPRKGVLTMLNISGKTKFSPGQIEQKVMTFFGPKGLNLALAKKDPDHMTFEGGGGYVDITICEEDKQNRVDIVTQEWDYQVKKFLSEL